MQWRVAHEVWIVVTMACFAAGCASMAEMRNASMEAQFKPACGAKVDTPQYDQCVQRQIAEMGPE